LPRLGVQANTWRCVSYNVAIGSIFRFPLSPTLGTVTSATMCFVELKWDKANHRFVERLYKSGTNTWLEQSLPYTISDSVPAIAPYKRLSANIFADNCVGTQTFADMGINFNNVFTN
jgi:hypothetical protein